MSPARRDPEGHHAASPWAIPAKGWKAVLLRAWNEGGNDNVGLVAAGVAFYGFLALVPMLAATVLAYGLFADRQTVISDMQELTSVMPADAAKLIGEQLMGIVRTSDEKKGFGILLALGLALFGARNGAGSVITALNIAYEEHETRSFIRVNLLALAITAAAVVVMILALLAVAGLGHLEALLPGLPAFVVGLGKILSYVVLTLAGAAGAATLFRYGPSRRKAKWVWLTPGSVLAALLWLMLTLGFGIYVAQFGNYNATYGSLGAVVVLLTWLYLSAYVLLFCAELNSELERQTVVDTTEGGPRPLGQRDATVADATVAPASAPAAPPPSPRPMPARAPAATNWAVARASAWALQAAGYGKVGALSSTLATSGLALLRRRDRVPHGAALIGTAIGLSLLRRRPPRR